VASLTENGRTGLTTAGPEWHGDESARWRKAGRITRDEMSRKGKLNCPRGVAILLPDEREGEYIYKVSTYDICNPYESRMKLCERPVSSGKVRAMPDEGRSV
jgi:hypothetical protein